MSADIINGTFELVGGLLYLLNIKILIKDKKIQGISLLPTLFFTSWGLWNLFYYPHLDQWFSFFGCIVLVTVNAVWLALAYYYSKVYTECSK